MTNLWLHVNTFFIIVLIFFRYSSYIKKYMTAYFICLCKLSFCSDGAFKFVLLFLKFFLPGTVKAVPAKLCAAFLCTLLNRLRFSPQNVGFGTKRREIRPLRRGTPSVCSRWSQPPSPRGRLNPLSHRCAMPAPPKGELFSAAAKFPATTKAVPLGKVASPQAMTEGVTPPRDCFRRKQARQLPFAFTTPPVKKGFRKVRRLS